MESISTKKLPPIFKLSLLSKILPYFGYLHDWKRVLESINKKTNDIWDQRKEELKYLGRELKFSCHLESRYIKFSENILLKAEIFKFQTDRFCRFYCGTEKTQDKIKELGIDILILQLCSQLNEDNSIVFQKCGKKYEKIFLQTRKEIAEMMPSPNCASSILEIKMFEDSQAQDLCKYITDSIELKGVIVKKNENNTFEVDSITSHNFLNQKDYNILNEEFREKLATYYSCPVSNCICKPQTLFLNSCSLHNMTEEQIDEICGLSLLENAYRLKVDGVVENFSEISYLSRIKHQFPKLEILFNFESWRDSIKARNLNSKIHINSGLITLVAKGEVRIFQISGNGERYVSKILDLEFNKKENIAIIKCGFIWLPNIILRSNNKSKFKDKTLTNRLKERTRLEKVEYIIVDTSALKLEIDSFEIKKCINISKHFKFIGIFISGTESEYKEKIENINKLSKQCSIYILVYNLLVLINSDGLNLIDQDFNQIIVESWRFKIKLIKSNSKLKERMFTVFDSLFYKTKTVNIRELREMISKSRKNKFLS